MLFRSEIISCLIPKEVSPGYWVIIYDDDHNENLDKDPNIFTSVIEMSKEDCYKIKGVIEDEETAQNLDSTTYMEPSSKSILEYYANSTDLLFAFLIPSANAVQAYESQNTKPTFTAGSGQMPSAAKDKIVACMKEMPSWHNAHGKYNKCGEQADRMEQCCEKKGLDCTYTYRKKWYRRSNVTYKPGKAHALLDVHIEDGDDTLVWWVEASFFMDPNGEPIVRYADLDMDNDGDVETNDDLTPGGPTEVSTTGRSGYSVASFPDRATRDR